MSIRVVACEVLRLDVLMRLDLDLGFLLADFKVLQLVEEGSIRAEMDLQYHFRMQVTLHSALCEPAIFLPLAVTCLRPKR